MIQTLTPATTRNISRIIYFNREEFEIIEAFCKLQGLPLSALLRSLALQEAYKKLENIKHESNISEKV